MVPDVEYTVKSGSAAEEAEGEGWRLEEEDDQKKLDRWADCIVGLNC
jgi:hypothetical protein